MATTDKNFKVKNGIDIGGTATATLFSGSGQSLTGIPNSALNNSSITIGSTSVSLGSSATTIAGLTLTSPTISTITNTGTLTLPTSTDTLIGRATTDTLTNKSISGSTNTLSNIPNNALTNSSITINGSAVSLGGSTTISVPTSATPTVAGTVFGRTNAGSGALYLTALGNSAANSVTGTGNTAIGYNSMNGLVGGANNTSIGYQAFTPSGNTNISNNTAIGAFAAGNSYIGGNNVAVGYFALTGTTANTASNNTAIGYQAGANGTTNLTTGSNNILIGYNSGPSSATVSNEITLGDANITAFRIPGLSLTVNASNPIVQLTSTQTLTNKTLSSATLTGTLTAGGGVGTNGQFLQSTGSGLQWASVSSYSAPTIGSTSITSGGTFTTLPGVTSINGATVPSSGTLATLAGTETFTNKTLSTTSTSTVSTNTATTVDTTALSGFTTMKFVVSLKQGSKIRSSELIVQTDGTNVDYTEYGVVETGGTMNAVSVAASVSSTNCITTVYVANAATTNVTVKLVKILM